ncbi:MAG: integrase, partial [Clostridium sp.]|nr:integrase [Clostridium sp.]
WGILFSCHKINLQTGKSILHQFEGLHKLWDTPKHYLGDDFYPAIIDEETYQKAQEELINRAAALGRLNRTTKQKPIKTPTLFTIRDIEKHFDNPAAQAEYLYSLIDCEVD